jgi:hypothetical protein
MGREHRDTHVPHALMPVASTQPCQSAEKSLERISARRLERRLKSIKQVNVRVLRRRFGLIDDPPLQPSIAAEPREDGSKTNASCFSGIFDGDKRKTPSKNPHSFTLA